MDGSVGPTPSPLRRHAHLVQLHQPRELRQYHLPLFQQLRPRSICLVFLGAFASWNAGRPVLRGRGARLGGRRRRAPGDLLTDEGKHLHPAKGWRWDARGGETTDRCHSTTRDGCGKGFCAARRCEKAILALQSDQFTSGTCCKTAHRGLRLQVRPRATTSIPR